MKRTPAVAVLISLLLHSAAYGLQTGAPLQPVSAGKGFTNLTGDSGGVAQALAEAPHGKASPLSTGVVEVYTQTTLRLIATRRLSPPRASRSLAFALLSLREAAHLAHSLGRAINTDVAVQVAVNRTLQYLYPLDAQALQENLREGRAQTAPQVERASRHLGHAVANYVIQAAQQDGAWQAGTLKTVLPVGEGLWVALVNQQALEPGWGKVQPLLLARNELPAVNPPPAWNSPAFQEDRQSFLKVQAQLSLDQIQQANYWAAGAGTVTPLGMWIEKALLLSQKYKLSGEEMANVLALTAIAGHNAFIACWDGKFTYNVARPENWVTQVGWHPAISTPPFPSYPSGHATVSGAAAEVLASFFPAEGTTLRKEAVEAADSRVYGGIHWSIDGVQGLEVGQRVANATLNKVR